MLKTPWGPMLHNESHNTRLVCISFMSMWQVARVVLLDGFLTPLRLRLSDQAKAGTDSPSSYDKDFVSKDPRPETLATFRQAAQGVKQPLLVAEAEAHLSADLDSWCRPELYRLAENHTRTA
eukprot:2035681-Amphidinium_carterae.1